jgi:tRNA1(Val) A37 N6-methylase TrmN6
VDIFQLCRSCRLEPKTLRLVSGKPGEAPNIALVHCTKNGKSELKIEPVLCVHQPDGSYTEEILTIYEKNIKIQ